MCRLPWLSRGPFYRLPFSAETCSSCEKPCKVCWIEMAEITLLSVNVHDESKSADLFSPRLIDAFWSLPLVNRNQFFTN